VVIYHGDQPVWATHTGVPAAEPHLCHDRSASGPPHTERSVPSLPPRILSDGSVVGSARRPLVGETAKMWNVGQTLRVKMMGGTAHIRSKVRQYAEEWTRYANIHFEFVDPSQPAAPL
jgi:hypothetical protein